MNEDLRSDKINKYLSYIQMMYEGIKIKSFYFEPKKNYIEDFILMKKKY